MNRMTHIIAATLCIASTHFSSAATSLIKNGTFDEDGTVMAVLASRANGTYAYYSDGCTIPNWTFSGYAGLGVTNSAFMTNIDYDIGTYHMFLRAKGSASAEQTFTPTESGCYRLSMTYWAWQGSAVKTNYVYLVDGDTTKTLAVLTPSATSKRTYRFSTIMNLTAGSSYTLRLYLNATGDGGNVFDDITLVKVGNTNLVENGTFDEGSITGNNYLTIGSAGYSNPGWTGGSLADSSNVSGLAMYNADAFFKGMDYTPGKYAMFHRAINQTDLTSMQQDIAFPEAGLYRVAFTYFGWMTDNLYLSTEVRLLNSSGTVTNTVGAINHFDACWGKPLAYNGYVEIDEAGTYTLQFCMPGNYKNKGTANLIDNVVVSRCESENLIQNGGFEEGSGTGANYIRSDASDYSNPHWDLTGSGQTSYYVGLANAGVGFFGGKNIQAVGKHALYFRSSNGKAVSQTFTVGTAGIYSLSFAYWGWNKGSIPMCVDVLDASDGSVVASGKFTPNIALRVNNAYQYFEVSQFSGFVNIAEAGDYILKFSPSGSYDDTYATLIDNVVFAQYDGETYAAGDEHATIADMLPAGTTDPFSRPVQASKAIVSEGQTVNLGTVHEHRTWSQLFTKNDGTIVMDELRIATEYVADYIHLRSSYSESSTGIIRAGKIVNAMSSSKSNPRCRLSALSGETKFVVGEGGIVYDDNDRVGDCNPYYAVEKDVSIYPSADYTIGTNAYFLANPNQAIYVFDDATLTIGTTDYDDSTIARTVTCEGGIGSDASGVVNVTGIGTLLVNTCTTALGTLNVKDSATLLYTDASKPGFASISLASGTTLKVSRTSNLALGSALTCATGSKLSFDLTGVDPETSAITLNGLALPDSGKVNVQVTGRTPGCSCILMDNLPDGVDADDFQIDDGVRLRVMDNVLSICPSGMMMIVL